MGVEPFHGKGPHPILGAGSQAARGKLTSLCPQEPANRPYHEPDGTYSMLSHSISLCYVLISLHLCLGLPSGFCTKGT
jgi:hypothetical protein